MQNVVNEPIIFSTESVLEKIPLSPLHIHLGFVNKLYNDTMIQGLVIVD